MLFYERIMQGPDASQRVTFSLKLVATGDQRRELVQTFRSLLRPIRGSAGLLRCNLFEDVQLPDELQLLVEWRTREHFERHLETDVFRRILMGMDLAAEPPELEIRTISGVLGLDFVREFLGREDD